MKAMNFISDAIASAASAGKTILLSGTPSRAGKGKSERLIVMGNGPSLRDTVRDHKDVLQSHPTLAVNFAANTPEFAELKPSIYVLADPHFFRRGDDGKSSDSNVERLWHNISSADWTMSLYVPCKAKIPESIEKKWKY